jgi:hypothetical protein
MAASKVMNLRISGITIRRNSQDFFDSIGQFRRLSDVGFESASHSIADVNMCNWAAARF